MNAQVRLGTKKRGQTWIKVLNLFVAAILMAGLVVLSPNGEAQAADLLNTSFTSGTDGFVYQDDTFATSQPGYASGSRITTSSCYGGSGGCLNVRLGGVDTSTVTNMSGGWKYTLNLESAQTGVSLSLRYRLAMPLAYDYDEFSRVQVSLDGTLFGRGSKSYVDHTGGDNTFAHDSDWLQVNLYLGDLSVGEHTLIVGGYSNKKNASAEITDIYVDDVVLTSGNAAPVTSDVQILADRLELANYKSNVQSLAAFGDRCRNSTSCAPYTSFNNAQNWVEDQLEGMGYTAYKHNYTYSGWTGSNLYVTKVGSVHPEQMYIVSAHLDGRGGGGAADDDGSGISLLLEMARVLAGSDVETDVSVRFVFWDQEEIGLYGSRAYAADRRSLQGTEAEPTWLGVITHDMVMYDHGVGTALPTQSPYADLDVEWRDGTTFAAQSKVLAQKWRFVNGEYAELYPANSANNSTNTDDTAFHPYVASISVRENRRGLSGEWINPYYHQTTDVYANYSDADFDLGFDAVRTTLGLVAELAGARVISANEPPVANGQAVSTDEDTPVGITLTGSDADGDLLTYEVLTDPLHGSLSGTAPDLTYTPVAGYGGADSFTFRVNDGTVNSTPATVSITVNLVNQAPTADNQSVSTDEDMAVAITLTGSDPENDSLVFSIVDAPLHGTLSGTAPALTYTPANHYNGPDSFTFIANDGIVDSDLATVSLTVTAVNDPPVATPQSLGTDQGMPISVTLTGTDVDGDPLTFRVTVNPAHGSLSGTPPALTYTPVSGYVGVDNFRFVSNDGKVDSSPAAILITVREAAFTLPFTDNFESEKRWTVNPDGTDTAPSGKWERGNPEGTDSDGPKQLDITTSESINLVTGRSAGSNANSYDVDGVTTIRSPLIQLPAGQDITLSFKYYFAHGRNATTADYFRVKVIGSSTQTVLEVRGTNKDIDAAWKSFQASLKSFTGQSVRIQLEAADLAKNSLVEAAVDDLSIVVAPANDTLVSANFDSNANGFVYQDDVFLGTSQPDYASGEYLPSGGVSGGGLQVTLGGLDPALIYDISGGWKITFNLPSAENVVVSFWYNLTQSPDYDKGDISQALVSVDGVLYGTGGNDYLAQINGNGNGGIFETTGWQFVSLDLGSLTAGNHQLMIGGYNNQKSYTNEWTEVLIDSVTVKVP